MIVSIIIPVLNEAAGIDDLLASLRLHAVSCEIIVADGGSTDQTTKVSARLADRVITAPRGRASQMNAGAAVATGEVFWFVHADSYIPPECLGQMQAFLTDPCHSGGCFSLHIDSPRWIYRARDVVGNACVDLFGLALGDRALFCRREAFHKIGGYRDLPLLEDGEFYRRLSGIGRTCRLDAVVRTSARRYEELGPVRTILVYALVVMLFCAGLPMKFLERILHWHLRRANARCICH